MTEFIIATGENQDTGTVEPGDVKHLTFPLSSFGNANTEDDVQKVEITIFQRNNDGSRNIVNDANGDTMDRVEVTDTDEPDGVEPVIYRYGYEVPDGAASGVYVAEWRFQLNNPFEDQVIQDRFEVSGEKTSVSFGG